jgi:hypothetical protein
VLDLYTADYTFVNERLAKHYGMPNVSGERVPSGGLSAGTTSAGMLGHGSVLTLTSLAIAPRRCCAASG